MRKFNLALLLMLLLSLALVACGVVVMSRKQMVVVKPALLAMLRMVNGYLMSPSLGQQAHLVVSPAILWNQV